MLEDRDYYREGSYRSGGIQFGSPRMVVSWLVLLNVGVFILNLLLSTQRHHHWLMTFLSLQPENLAQPWMWWRLLTYGFAHDPSGISHILWNMVGLWFFGRPVEERLGRGEFLRFYLACVLLGGIIWAVRQLVAPAAPLAVEGPSGPVIPLTLLLGASGGVTGVLILFAILFPRQTVYLHLLIPVPAWILAIIIVALNVLGAMSGQSGTAFDVHLVGAALAGVYGFTNLNFRWLDFGGLQMPQMPRRQPRLRVHRPLEPEDEGDPELDAEADRILDKLHREGADSLSPKERKVLEAYSRRMRQKRR